MPSGVIDADRAIEILLHWLSAAVPKLQLSAVGHRVVHGGPDFSRPVALDDGVIAELTRLAPLAPLHQPFNLKAIAAARAAFPGVPQVACFDTAFHTGHAFEEAAFGLPRAYYEQGIRRYGFHGLSYDYVARQLARDRAGGRRRAGRHRASRQRRLAVRGAQRQERRVDHGVLGARRPDDGHPLRRPRSRRAALPDGRKSSMDAAALTDLLYRESGLKGLSGVSHDMRALEASAEPHAAQAIACFVARIRREIGAMAAAMGGIDALVFTGGIGENSARIRAAVTTGSNGSASASTRRATPTTRSSCRRRTRGCACSASRPTRTP